MRKLLYVIFTALFIVACANMGSPDGGPFDEDPPKIVRTSPKYGSVVSNVKKIVLEFNENVKIDNAQENVIISPPQVEMPEIEAIGKKIVIKLLDSIKPNTTYTIDFADAIKDKNEDNPMGDYAFMFSTGGEVDTMQVSGYVLNASDLEPIKSIYVGVYALEDSAAVLDDSVFKTKPLERVSRTDASGHFVIKGLNKSYYRIFALNDQNQNYFYDQKSELLAFSSRVFRSSCEQDLRTDTVWHDSLRYDSINYTVYTHFYPDDLTLTAFMAGVQDRKLLKVERPQLNMFTIAFTEGADTLPCIRGVNFDAENAFVIDATQKNDTLNYWIRDSLVYNIDTLEFLLDYYKNDSAGLVLTTDTFSLVSKISKAKIEKQNKDAYDDWAKEYRKQYKAELRAKQLEEEENSDGEGKSKKEKEKKTKIKDEDIEIPPMPEQLVDVRVSPNTLDPDKNIDFIFPEPIDSFDLSKFKFYTKKDTVEIPQRYLLEKVEGKQLVYRLYAEWQPDSTYYLVCDTGMFVTLYGKRSAPFQRNMKVGSMDTYSTLFVTLQNADSSAVVQLLNTQDKVVKEIAAEDGKADFYFIKPGTYYMRVYYDRNGNGEWDTGDYDSQLQPEEVFYYPKPMELKAQWEITQEFNPTAVPLAKQKPLAITKQKDKKKDKTFKSKNQKRLEDKKNGVNGQSNSRSGFGSSGMGGFGGF